MYKGVLSTWSPVPSLPWLWSTGRWNLAGWWWFFCLFIAPCGLWCFTQIPYSFLGRQEIPHCLGFISNYFGRSRWLWFIWCRWLWIIWRSWLRIIWCNIQLERSLGFPLNVWQFSFWMFAWKFQALIRRWSKSEFPRPINATCGTLL